MPLFLVLIRRSELIEVVLEADDSKHAVAEAEWSMGPGVNEQIQAACAQGVMVTDTDRATVYRCSACTEQTDKRMWGPGWRTCPVCKEQDTSLIVNA